MSIFYSMGTSDADIDALSARDLSNEAEERLSSLESDKAFLVKIKTEHEVIVATIEKRNQDQPTQHIADALADAKANVEAVELTIAGVQGDIDSIDAWDEAHSEDAAWDKADWIREQRRDYAFDQRAG
ncbi:hypothetical protein [Asaia sp. HumB]|uniref:hypothetical protein n=1 Tax=Asaia sp. HumB TaxID=3035475 RepID=UPI0025527966|nr:hypothetical protein [Asaia sp. HumB]MDL2172433.1 hypothetical protein [Asaia sp. HumB]